MTNWRNRISRASFKLLTLVLVLVMTVTSVPTAIALDSAAAVAGLYEQTLTLRPEDGVTLTLSGMMPAGADAEAVPVEMNDDAVLHAYDITIYDRAHRAFEPAQDQPISVSFESEAIAGAIEDSTSVLEVEHIADDGSREAVEVILAEDDELVFEAESFSIYLIKVHDTDTQTVTKRRTYVYLSNYYEDYTADGAKVTGRYISGLYQFPNKGGDMVSTQTVKNGEKLQPVVLPENFDWGYFYGWYIVDIDLSLSKAATAAELDVDPDTLTEDDLTRFVYEWESDPPIVRSNVYVNDITEDERVYLAPLYTNYRFVTFHEKEPAEGETANIVTRKLIALGNNMSAHVVISDVEATPSNVEKLVFYGWKLDGQIYKTRNADGSVIDMAIEVDETDTDDDASIDLYPAFREARWITFDAGGEGALFVGALFTHLDSEDDPTYIKQLPATTRPGYVFDGWYTGTKNQTTGEITYDTRVSKRSEYGASAIETTGSGRTVIDEYGSYLSHGELHLRGPITLYARWEPADTADYKVVVWQQKVTDNKNAADSEKKYDYYTYTTVENAAYHSVILDSASYQALGYEDLSFEGFHYSRTEVVNGKKTYRGDIPEERVQGTVASDGSTVVNVYYDRDLMVINYYYNSTAPAGATSPAYLYTADPSGSGTQYGLVDGGYVTLTRGEAAGTSYSYNLTYRYTASTSTSSGNYYIVENNEYTQVYLYYNNRKWYRTRTGTILHSYSDEYTGTRYTRSNNGGAYTGTRYLKDGGSFAQTAAQTGALYGQDTNGNYVELTVTEDTEYNWLVSSTGQLYTGTRYIRSSVSGFSAMLTWTGLYDQTFAQSGYHWSDVGGRVWNEQSSGDGVKQSLLDAFTRPENPYNLYDRGKNGSYEIRHYKQGLDGKYSQSDVFVAHNDSSSVNFNFTNKFDGFTVASYSTSGFSVNGGTSSTYPGAPQVSSVRLPLYVYHTRNKYSLTYANYGTDNSELVYDGDQSICYEAPLAEYDITPPQRKNYIFAGWYEDKSCTKKFDFEHETMPSANKIVYAKWDLKRFFVEIDPNGGEMENGTVFSEYTGITSAEYYSTYTNLDYGETLAEYPGVTRKYIADNNGTYVYINMKYAETFDAACQKAEVSWSATKLPADYRAAFYCPITDVDKVFDEYFLTMVDKYGDPVNANEELITREFFKEYCVSKQAYSPIEYQESYELTAWYVVDENGNTTNEIYKFGDAVTEPIRIRAVWRKTGSYYLEFDPYMPLYNIGLHVPVTDEYGNTEILDNEVIYTPSNPYIQLPGQASERFIDGGEAVIRQEPMHIPDRYIFRGWELINRDGTGTGRYYEPHDKLIVESKYADHDGVIHFRACYEPEKESLRRVDVADLTLDANGGHAIRNGLDETGEYISVDLQNNQVNFNKQPNNFEVKLRDYYYNFGHSDGFMLLGWDEEQVAENFIPTYAADAVIGVDTKGDENILYAAWEAMYYLTLENFSTEYDVTFDLSFSNYDSDVYSGNTNTVISQFERELFSEHNLHNSDDGITVEKISTGHFTVTIPKTADRNDPTRIKLVLPEGENAVYTVSGSVDNAVSATGSMGNKTTQDLTMSVYNSGGASEQMTYGKYGSGWNQKTGWHNLANTGTKNYSVTGTMKLGAEGQNVAFYTDTPERVQIKAQSCYYDLESGEWIDGTRTTGPCATLSFVNATSLGGTPIQTNDGNTGYSNLEIIKNTANTYGVTQTFTNTAGYKFIGWYSHNSASPDTPSIDGKTSSFGDSEVNDLRVPNEGLTYYALYVPIVNGEVGITHERAANSVGYAKKLYVKAEKHNTRGPAEFSAEDTAVNDSGELSYRAKAEITVPVTEEQADNGDKIDITLKAMAGYGCTYNSTYEGIQPFANGERDESTATEVYLVADDYTTPHETKYYYTYTRELDVADLYQNSEEVKGLRTLNTKEYFSDFNRNYQFTYTYVSRDGVTRKYVVTDTIAQLRGEDDLAKLVTERAPYISNFREVFTWDTSTIKTANLDTKGVIMASMDAAQQTLAKRTVTIQRFGAAVTTSMQVNQGYAIPEEDRPTAELLKTVDGKQMQFYRWKISETLSNGKVGDFVMYWYNPAFAAVVWEDYTIEEEYREMAEGQTEYETVRPDDEMYEVDEDGNYVLDDQGNRIEKAPYVTVEYLDSTRNQWVGLDENGQVRLDDEGNMTYYDKLISDYSIAFVDQGHRINNDPDRDTKYQLGLLLEKIDTITDSTDLSSYSVPVLSEEDEAKAAQLREKVVNLVKNQSAEYGVVKQGGSPKFYYSRIAPDSLNDANRIEYYRALDNVLGEDGKPAEGSNALFIFNVYAYMVKDGVVYISTTPITLTLYHLAIMTVV